MAEDIKPERAGDSCKRCGTCCQKGGPSLHREDLPLVDSGQIPGRCLVTIRQGELAWDNVRGILAALPREIVKIKGRSGGWTCRFYEKAARGCRIYDYRPLECRVLNCRDTRWIERVYATDRLTRQDLLSSIQGLWDLVEDHEQRCSYASLDAWVREGSHGRRPKQETAILETLRFDSHVRRLAVEKGRLDAGMLDFIFGRPLTDTIKMFDLKLVKEKGSYALVLGQADPVMGPGC